ncbi:hypothetical protein HMI54_004814 [Coelomomyces lativittatus]|nr:hypothetical protein HMI54_004814 [Coelomomyces lativittatus]KAJ1513139.1 hypothetical protein HMI56_002975 [Coelomomyces lativittatus]
MLLFFLFFFSPTGIGLKKKFKNLLAKDLGFALLLGCLLFLHSLNSLCMAPIPFAVFITLSSIFFTTVRGNFRILFILSLISSTLIFIFSGCLLMSDELS